MIGIVYVWSTEEYYLHCDTAQYKNDVWYVDAMGKTASPPLSKSNKLQHIEAKTKTR